MTLPHWKSSIRRYTAKGEPESKICKENTKLQTTFEVANICYWTLYPHITQIQKKAHFTFQPLSLSILLIVLAKTFVEKGFAIKYAISKKPNFLISFSTPVITRIGI